MHYFKRRKYLFNLRSLNTDILFFQISQELQRLFKTAGRFSYVVPNIIYLQGSGAFGDVFRLGARQKLNKSSFSVIEKISIRKTDIMEISLYNVKLDSNKALARAFILRYSKTLNL